MFICYSPETPLRHTNPKRALQRILLCLSFFFSALPIFAQENPSSAEIDALLQQRNERIAQSMDTRAIDLQLYELGVRPLAVTHTESLENGALRVTFPAYIGIPEQKKHLITDRLTGAYPELSSMEINTSTQEVTFILTPGTSATAIDNIVLHFGYSGHEEH
jgi:hypothetical protein